MMNPQHQQVIEYVQTHLAQGYTHQQIADHLRAHGWTAEQINWVFAHASVARPQAPAAQQILQNGHATYVQQQYAQPMAPQQAQHQPTPAKYRVFRAIADVFRAVKRNPLGVLASLGVAIGLNVVGGVLVTIVIIVLGQLNIGFEFTTTGAIVGLVGLAVLSCAVVTTIYAAVLGSLTRALVDGASGRRSNIPALVTVSIKQAPRVIWAGAQLYARAVLPAIILLILLIPLSAAAPPLGSLLSFLGVLASGAWAIIALLRYALAIPVAVLEPELRVSDCFARSYQLVKDGGQWFVVKATGLLIGAVLLLMFISGQNPDRLDESSNPIVSIAGLVFELVYIGVLAVLYRNRSIVHAHHKPGVQ